MAQEDLDNIFAVLHKKAEDEVVEKAPLAPYAPLKRAPPKFEYDKYTLMPPEDARKINQTLDALNARAESIAQLDNEYKELRVEIEQKIQELQVAGGYDKIKSEMSQLRDKLAGDVEGSLEEVGDALIEHKNVVLTIIEQITKGKVTDSETKNAMIAAVTKYASPEIAGQILEDANRVLAETAKAKEQTKRRLISWPSPQDLRKKIKTEQASVSVSVTAGVMDVLQSVADGIKGLWTSAKDSVSSLWSSVENAQPVVDEMKGLLEQSSTAVATASKKKADYIDRNDAGVRNDYVEKLVELMGEDYVLDNLVRALGDDVAVSTLKYVAQTQDLDYVIADIARDAGNRHEYADALAEVMGATDLLDNIVRALSDDDALSAFDYMVQMGDMSDDLEDMFGDGRPEDEDIDNVLSALEKK